MDEAGGADRIVGAPSLYMLSVGRGTLSLESNKIYLMAFHVDRPIRMLGARLALTTASGGAVARGGIYALGVSSGNSWEPGARVADYGTVDAGATGHTLFDLATPVDLAPGWYFHALGIAGGGKARVLRWIAPGTAQYFPYGSGSGADYRISGMTRFLKTGTQTDAIANGLPESLGTVGDSNSADPYILQALVPVWQSAD